MVVILPQVKRGVDAEPCWQKAPKANSTDELHDASSITWNCFCSKVVTLLKIITAKIVINPVIIHIEAERGCKNTWKGVGAFGSWNRKAALQ